jgi:hypothetical protein
MHTPAVVGPGLLTSWETCLRRCDSLVKACLESRTIYSLGVITAKANAKGHHLTGGWIRQKAMDLKEKYPKMPGVAFYQHSREESAEVKELIQACDEIRGELWPG